MKPLKVAALMDVPKQTAWKVYLNHKWVDTVFFDTTLTMVDVYDSLVNHDGLDPRIKLSKEGK